MSSLWSTLAANPLLSLACLLWVFGALRDNEDSQGAHSRFLYVAALMALLVDIALNTK